MRAPAPVALMAAIFWFSAQSNLDTGLGMWDVILRKLAHAVIYGALGALWYWTLRPTTRNALPAAAVISALYAVSDEYHQSFVDGRGGTGLDVGIDLAGIGIASLLLRYDHRVRSAIERDGGRTEQPVAVPGDRRPADGPRRRPPGAPGPLRGRGDGLREERGSAPD
jgi:VanZ family protein